MSVLPLLQTTINSTATAPKLRKIRVLFAIIQADDDSYFMASCFCGGGGSSSSSSSSKEDDTGNPHNNTYNVDDEAALELISYVVRDIYNQCECMVRCKTDDVSSGSGSGVGNGNISIIYQQLLALSTRVRHFKESHHEVLTTDTTTPTIKDGSTNNNISSSIGSSSSGNDDEGAAAAAAAATAETHYRYDDGKVNTST